MWKRLTQLTASASASASLGIAPFSFYKDLLHNDKWNIPRPMFVIVGTVGLTIFSRRQSKKNLQPWCTVVPSVLRMTHSPYASPSIAILSSKLSILHPASPTISMSMILLDIWSLVAIQLHKNCKSWLLPTSIFNAKALNLIVFFEFSSL